MAGVWQEAIVRVFIGPDGADLAGTGTLVRTPQHGPCVLTCAHVVNFALGYDANSSERPQFDKRIRFDLPMKAPGRFHEARVIEWARPYSKLRDKHPVSDIALLKVLGSLPGDLRLHGPEAFETRPAEGDRVYSFGFSRDDGAYAEGVLRGTGVSGWLHIEATGEKGDFIESGFSGAPLFDLTRQRILGMVASRDTAEGKLLAFAISQGILCQACPQIARPYRGLRPFDEQDADFFYGREDFVDRLVEKVATHPLVGVTAASGAGKSSAIRAGLIPRLRRENALIVTMRPADDPWKDLARALVEKLAPSDDPLKLVDEAAKRAERLRVKPHLLRDYAAALLKQHGATRIVMFVDQFEELFTQAGHEPEETDGRDQFDSAPDERHTTGANRDEAAARPGRGPDFRDLMVATASLEGDVPIQWLYALRGDFAGRAFRHPEFVRLLSDGDIKLPEMRPEDVRNAIWLPADKMGAAFEPGLIERIAQDAGARVGSLPLMQHVLEQLWQRLGDRCLTHNAYDLLGGVAGSLDRHAERAYGALKAEQRKIARRLFSRLVHVTENGEATRRVLRRSDLDLADVDTWAVAEALATERLLVLSNTVDANAAASVDAIAELAHEALLRHWDRLRKWVDDDRAFQLWHQKLSGRLTDWANGRGELLTGAGLDDAKRHLTDRRDDLTFGEREFINASERAETRRRHWLAIAVVALTVLSGLTTMGALVAIKFYRNEQVARGLAETQLAEAQLQQARVLRGLAKDAQRSRLIEYAYLLLDRVFSDGLLARASETERWRLRLQARFLPDRLDAIFPTDGAVWHATFNQDGSLLATASDNKTAWLWDTTSGKELAILEHTGAVRHVAFSEDGSLLATASSDSTARLWNTASGKELAKFEHTGAVWRVAFNYDGSLLATASSDSTARLWDTTSGKELAKLEHGGIVWHVAFDQDGIRLATASDDYSARLWDTASGKELAKLEHGGGVWHATFNHDGSRLATASDDYSARLWDTASGKELTKLVHTGAVRHVAFSEDGSLLATASEDNARLWDTASGKELAKLEHGDTVWHVAFSEDGSRLATTSDDYSARLWDTASGKELAKFEQDGIVWHVAFSEDGSRLATASADYTARLWDRASGKELAKLEHGDTVWHVAFNHDGSRLATASDDYSARLWNTASGKELAKLEHTGAVRHVAFSEDGSLVATASSDSTARLWDTASGEELAKFEHGGIVLHVAFNPDGNRLATASWDDTARLWDTASGKELAKLEHSGIVWHATFNHDGSHLATASSDSTARLWDAASGKELTKLEHGGSVTQVAFNPDGSLLATASEDTARLWDTASGKELAKLEHGGSVTQVAFNRDGSLLATASDDYSARLWDTASGKQLAKREHAGAIRHVAFSEDGSLVATASADYTASVSKLGVYLEAIAAAFPTRLLTDDELRTAFLDDETTEVSENFLNLKGCHRFATDRFDPAVGTDNHNDLPTTTFDKRNLRRAREKCRAALMESPDDPRLHYQLGSTLAEEAELLGKADNEEGRIQKTKLLDEARAHLAQAEKADYAAAAFALAGLTPDTAAKRTLYERAHELGDPRAARALSSFYMRGDGGVTRDPEKSLRWLRRGANQGDPWAHAELGELYWKGEGLAVRHASAGKQAEQEAQPAPLKLPQNWPRAFCHVVTAVRIWDQKGYGYSEDARVPRYRRAHLARKLEESHMAALWEQAYYWRPGEPYTCGEKNAR